MKKKILICILIIFIFSLYFFPDRLLNEVSKFLVHSDTLEPAEAIIVLSGSSTGNRIEAGVKLFQKGLGKIIIISGEKIFPGYHTHSLMKNHAINLGVPADKIIASRIEGELSTWGEGIHNLQKLKENKFKSFILVTSAFHTNRAHAVYEKLINHLGYDFKFMVYPAKDNRVPINDWWKNRKGRKSIFMEYLATLNFYREHL